MAVFDDSAANAPGEVWPEAAASAVDAAHLVYEQFRGTIFSYLVSLRIEQERARDLTQECFFKYYLIIRAGGGIREPRPWLFKTASRLALNHFREIRSGRTISLEDLTTEKLGVRYQVGSAEEDVIKNDRLDQLSEALRALSPQQQICLHLRAEGLRYREIAEALDISVPTVSEFVRRGIARLRRTLDA